MERVVVRVNDSAGNHGAVRTTRRTRERSLGVIGASFLSRIRGKKKRLEGGNAFAGKGKARGPGCFRKPSGSLDRNVAIRCEKKRFHLRRPLERHKRSASTCSRPSSPPGDIRKLVIVTESSNGTRHFRHNH